MSSVNVLPDYVLEQLEKIAKTTGFHEYRFEQDVCSNNGDGFISKLVKITVIGQRYVDGRSDVRPDKLVLICKMLPTGKARRRVFSGEFAFAREVEMYNHILPLLVKFQTNKGLTKANGFFEFPHCYYALADAVQDRYLIILDDLRPVGYTLWNKLLPIEYDNVRLMMTALGRFHGVSFALRDQQPDVFATIQLKQDILLHMATNSTALSDIFDGSLDMSIRLFEGRPELEFLMRQKIAWKDDLRAVLEHERSGRFSVVGHGDCWNNNFMFLNGENGVEEIRLLDWQLSRLASPAIDLTYFFMLSTTKELRDKHFHEFLQIYYTQLAVTVRACGSDPERVFTFSDLQNELKRAGHYGLIVAPTYLQMIMSKPDDLQNLDTLVEWDKSNIKAFSALDDATTTLYVQRLSDLINDCNAYGWLE